MTGSIGIIGGAGWLGNAIAQGVAHAAIVPVDRLWLSYRTAPSIVPARANWTQDSQELVDHVDIVIVSVRPHDLAAITAKATGKLVISVMAGITLEHLAAHFATDRVVRALPNAGAEVRHSYTPWIASAAVDAADRQSVTAIFSACGVADEVASESDIDYFTGLTGSGPAYPALLMAAMQVDAVRRGIDPAIARRAIAALFIGSGRLWEQHAQSPDDVVQTFLDYKGTTAAAIEAMRDAGFDDAVARGLEAAFQKSVQMGLSS